VHDLVLVHPQHYTFDGEYGHELWGENTITRKKKLHTFDHENKDKS